MIIKFACMLHR